MDTDKLEQIPGQPDWMLASSATGMHWFGTNATSSITQHSTPIYIPVETCSCLSRDRYKNIHSKTVRY